MLEKMFTTKMSADKKKLQSRFSKIRSQNGRLSKLLGGVLFGIVIIAIISVGVIIAVSNVKDYRMTDKEFSDYINRPIGSIMADLDYVDDEKLVFHYLEGFFVVDQQNYEIRHKINLNKLNIAGHTQGDCFTIFKIDKDGDFAYLINEGLNDIVGNYDNYIINLDTGEVKVGSMPDGTELFANYADTLSAVEGGYGWASNRCIIDDNGRTYYLTTQDSITAAIQLVTIHHKDNDNVSMRYVFGKNYVSAAQRKDNIIKESLAEGEEILTNSGLKWDVNADTVRSVVHKLSELRQMPYKEIPDSSYLVTIYAIDNMGESYQKLFIIDNNSMELVLSERLVDEDYYMGIINILNSPVSELYHKTAEFLEQEFDRVYTPYYDIQSLIISNWQENGNEATFFYKMSYLNYNRNPDTVDYIQQAKKRGQKEYEALYNDYLSLKESNYIFKVVQKGDEIELYSDVSAKGIEKWERTEIDDYIISE